MGVVEYIGLRAYQPIATCGYCFDSDSNTLTLKIVYRNWGNSNTKWIFNYFKELGFLNNFGCDNNIAVIFLELYFRGTTLECENQ